MENTPMAPSEPATPAASVSETTPTNANAAPASAPAPAAPVANIPADKIEAFNKFMDKCIADGTLQALADKYSLTLAG